MPYTAERSLESNKSHLWVIVSPENEEINLYILEKEVALDLAHALNAARGQRLYTQRLYSNVHAHDAAIVEPYPDVHPIPAAEAACNEGTGE